MASTPVRWFSLAFNVLRPFCAPLVVQSPGKTKPRRHGQGQGGVIRGSLKPRIQREHGDTQVIYERPGITVSPSSHRNSASRR